MKNLLKPAAILTVMSLLLTACVSGENYQEAIDQARAAGRPLVITRVATSHPNSAGGVDISIDAINSSSKTIKYVNYKAVAYNAVGDRVRGEIRRNSFASLEETGPIAPNARTSAGVWSNSWYNHSIKCARLSSLTITYMDNSKRSYSGKSITNMLTPNAYQSCTD